MDNPESAVMKYKRKWISSLAAAGSSLIISLLHPFDIIKVRQMSKTLHISTKYLLGHDGQGKLYNVP